jgi:hypothetical protein
MNILSHISLGIAAFLYLVPMQFFHHGNDRPAGEAAMGLLMYFFVTIPLGIFLFVSWCALLAQGGFSWIGGGRGAQLLLITVTALAFTAVISIGAVMRGDPQMPWALRPLMPWGLYILPLFLIVATFAQVNGTLATHIPPTVSRGVLIACSALVLASSAGMIVEWLIWQEKRATAAAKEQVAFEDRNLRSLVEEVEALDPIKDLGRLLGHAAANRYQAPRDLAVKKIQTHPRLQEELTLKLTNEWKLEALGYLELNDAPDNAALAVPVRTALESMAFWMKREIEGSTHHWPEAYYSETKMALAVADKFAAHGIDYIPAIKAWRAAFDHPNAKQANIRAPQLIDAWLATKTQPNKSHAAASSRR